MQISEHLMFERLAIPDVILFKHKPFKDDRGFFFESYQKERFDRGLEKNITSMQDNHSQSSKGVLRGLHYQLPPFAQAKLVRVTRGEVFDVAVDIRRSSPTFGRYVGTHLSEDNFHELYIPEGFAHGFVVLSERADFLYKTTAFYNQDSERVIRWDDPALNIDWHFEGNKILTPKDLAAPLFSQADCFE